MVAKTREKLIDVARQLFAHKGVENTTMNDIAAASDKGRRTIYTYFKNKREIYNAVIERESEQLLSRLREVALASLSPFEKLERYLQLRFSLMTEMVSKHDSLRSLFDRDIRRADRVRKIALLKEREIFEGVLREGVDAGAFDPVQADRLTVLETLSYQNIDSYHNPDIYEATGLDMNDTRDKIIKFIIQGIRKTEISCT
ncbi:MAG: TetR/AcrR family transcriptional regulator [Bacteroidales bacterium]|nr:TetR/AcrR family transcriptional regulator [Bacteroidales bacterium]